MLLPSCRPATKFDTVRTRRLAARVLIGLIVAGALTIGIFSLTGQRPARPPAPAADRDGRWRQDLKYLAGELPRLHADAFHTLPRGRFEDMVAALEREISALDDHAIRIRIVEIGAAIGDAHTGVSGWDGETHSFPFYAQWFSDGLWVTHVAPGYERLLGLQLLRIREVPVDAALLRAGGLIAHENEARLRQASSSHLNNAEVLHTLGLHPQRDHGVFTFRTPGGDTTVLDLPALHVAQDKWKPAVADPPLYRQHRDAPFWSRYLEESGTLYVRYHRAEEPLRFWRFAREVRRALNQQPVQRVIVDLRGNGGGNSQQFRYLLLPGLRRFAAGHGGALYAVIDRGTFSSGMLNAAELHRHAGAILVGEPSGGKPNGYGEVEHFRLPNSGLTVWYSTKYVLAYPERGDAPALVPDVQVPVSSAAYFAARDPVLDSLLSGPDSPRQENP